MGKYLKKFNSHAEYNAFTATTAFILPNVSLCVNEDDLHYNPLVRVSGVTLDKSELSIKEGDTETLVANVLPYNASNKNVVWSSSDDSVATVSSNGTVSGVSAGNADITVTTEDGGYTAQCSTSVKSYKVITYTATAKLPETTSYYDIGLHTNAFIGASGQQLTMVSHTFKDGVGTVTFNGDIAKFGENAFYSATSLTNIDIPDSVTSIGERAFAYCRGLTSIDFPDAVTTIGDNVCSGCSSLTSATISSDVTSIGNNAFYYCGSLTRLNSDVDGVFNLPSGVTSIGGGAFYYCSGLTSIVIPDSVTTLGNDALSWCRSLTSCTIGSGVTDIRQSVFYNCGSLISIVIPDSVTTINGSAFDGCTSLTSIVIPDSVTSIGNAAFSDCRSLTRLNSDVDGVFNLPSGVTSIGSDTFAKCYGLTSIDIPDSVTSIGKYAFQYCSLTSIYIPDSVTSIDEYAFYNCRSLTSITCNAITPPTLGANAFSGMSNFLIYVPSESVDTYKSASGWSTYASRIQPIV